MKILRTYSTGDDASMPQIGTGQSFESTRKVRFFPEISNGGMATFTILAFEDGRYVPIGQHTSTDDRPFEITVDRNSDVNVYTTEVTGSVGLKARLTNFQ